MRKLDIVDTRGSENLEPPPAGLVALAKALIEARSPAPITSPVLLKDGKIPGVSKTTNARPHPFVFAVLFLVVVLSVLLFAGSGSKTGPEIVLGERVELAESSLRTLIKGTIVWDVVESVEVYSASGSIARIFRNEDSSVLYVNLPDDEGVYEDSLLERGFPNAQFLVVKYLLDNQRSELDVGRLVSEGRLLKEK